MKIKKCSFTTKIHNQIRKESKVVQGFRVGDSGLGFFNYCTLTRVKKLKWHLVHLQSGLRICQFRSQKRLKESLKEITALTNWNKTQKELTVQNDVNITTVRRLREIQTQEEISKIIQVSY